MAVALPEPVAAVALAVALARRSSGLPWVLMSDIVGVLAVGAGWLLSSSLAPQVLQNRFPLIFTNPVFPH